jgi:agmatine deiminase
MVKPIPASYRMPAEWERHEATWFSWPHNPETWPGIPLEAMEKTWCEMILALCPDEKIHINVLNSEMENRARAFLQAGSVELREVTFHHFPTNDAWIRDHGPVFIIEEKPHGRQVLLMDWDYNSWGEKYPPYDLDNAIPRQVADFLEVNVLRPGLVLEGGSIEVNGSGTLMTTESCLLNPNRNGGLPKQEMEGVLRKYFGVHHFLWLGEGIVGDDTDGHIDDLARFVGPRTVVTVVEDDPQDENYLVLKDNWERLRSMTDERGRPLEVIKLPMPSPVESDIGRLPASYANFYIGNGAVLVPTFNDPRDKIALDTLKKLIPHRKILGIDCRELVKGLGAIHCVTQQQPA